MGRGCWVNFGPQFESHIVWDGTYRIQVFTCSDNIHMAPTRSVTFTSHARRVEGFLFNFFVPVN